MNNINIEQMQFIFIMDESTGQTIVTYESDYDSADETSCDGGIK